MTDTQVNTHKTLSKLKRETDELREAWYQFAYAPDKDEDEYERKMDRVETSILRVVRLVKILDTSEI